MSTGSRMLQFLTLLQNHRFWAGDDLAARLGVSPRTLRRDVEQLRELGYPVETTRGVGGGYRLSAGGSLPPLMVSDEEALAIVLGLRAVTASGVLGVQDAAVGALAKIVPVLPMHVRKLAAGIGSSIAPLQAQAGAPQVEVAVLASVATACRDRTMLAFDYEKRDGASSTRLVEPHALVPIARRWYLVAFDGGAGDWRTFRLDRMRGVDSRPRSFGSRPIPGGDADAFVQASIRSRPSRYEAVVRVEVPVDRARAEVGQWGDVSELDGGWSEVRMRTDELDYVVYLLARLDAPCEVAGPPELVDRLSDWHRRLSRAVGPGGSADRAPQEDGITGSR
ncbi:helix-turn-helix transcriptional regulator [Pseudoclavibacter terrae]|uniref:YafY family transcriptional regulator n=1 Tax=Pseudoclavibacter terrae TaxID=1530195 RepID=A0A7J5B0U9_9MICO|nr:YafY family protein [Pseudoclavibacter terrae]KAB1637462.1 YafY family transcriptional regulator [Pseudoclavibacter terrae]